ncbi:hypothetical protein BDW62DRAFT_57106 [Aspergillus aurantiobrunneus]
MAAITRWMQQSLGRWRARTADQAVMRGWKEDETPGGKKNLVKRGGTSWDWGRSGGCVEAYFPSLKNPLDKAQKKKKPNPRIHCPSSACEHGEQATGGRAPAACLQSQSAQESIPSMVEAKGRDRKTKHQPTERGKGLASQCCDEGAEITGLVSGSTPIAFWSSVQVVFFPARHQTCDESGCEAGEFLMSW